MGKVETATKWMENLARDDSHGYDQQYRWGERGDYDCSAAIITAFEKAGIPVKSKYGATYTGNMKRAFLNAGFENVTKDVNRSTGAGLMRGDVLLNEGNHTAIYLGGLKEAEASINEFGGITGGQPGDQTGKEVWIRSYYNYPWDVILRYPEKLIIIEDGWWGCDTSFKAEAVFHTPQDGIISGQSSSMQKYLTHCLMPSWKFIKPESVKNGSTLVKAIQKRIGGIEADGVFGMKTCKRLQAFLGVEVDGWFGDKSVRAFQKWLNEQ